MTLQPTVDNHQLQKSVHAIASVLSGTVAGINHSRYCLQHHGFDGMTVLRWWWTRVAGVAHTTSPTP